MKWCFKAKKYIFQTLLWASPSCQLHQTLRFTMLDPKWSFLFINKYFYGVLTAKAFKYCMFELRLQIGLFDQNLVRKKRTLISNLILSNIINFQKQINYGQLQYKEGLYVFEAWFCVFVLCTRCAVYIVQSAYLKNLALTKRTLISNPD